MLREHYAPGEPLSSPTHPDSQSSYKGLMARCKESIRRASEYLDEEKREQHKHLHGVSVVMERLERREHEVEQRLASEMDDTMRKHLQKKLNVIHAQQKKGLAALEGLKQSPA